MAALSPHHAAADPPGRGDGGDPAQTALSAFAAIFAATGGGPGSATEILNLYAYRTSFTELNLGYGASLAMVLLALTLAISFAMFRLRRAR